jgi:hypothetical protein
MAIFQKSVIKKHLNNLDKEQVEKAYQKIRENYSPAKIEKIKQIKKEAQSLKAEIDKTDKEIDRKVYELYELSEEEIGIVENSVK